jgi:hypothetical protein
MTPTQVCEVVDSVQHHPRRVESFDEKNSSLARGCVRFRMAHFVLSAVVGLHSNAQS